MIEPGGQDSARRLMAERYGAAPPHNRRILVVAVTLVGAGLLAWLVWAAWAQSNPPVAGALRSFEIMSSHEVRVVIDATRSDGDAVECTVRALSEDGSVVAEDVVASVSGDPGSFTFEATVRTDRQATTATVSGCH